MTKQYVLETGSTQHKFQLATTPVQIMGGGYGNGKTTAGIIKMLRIAEAYPGANLFIGRATAAKLRQTTMKAFFQWCPPKSIARMPTKDDPTCRLTNGTSIVFGYIRQDGKGTGTGTTSNILSASYDAIFIDQVEDPELTHEDFLALMGRLRGDTPYRGTDKNMPKFGPQWLLLACNPTRNWVYRKLVMPLEMWERNKLVTPDLLMGEDGNVLISLFSGSTHENARNLKGNYIANMQATYRGAMAERMIEGKWAAYEGLVYPDFDPAIHVVPRSEVERYYKAHKDLFRCEFIDGYDYGITSPCVYLIGYVDTYGNVIVADGYKETDMTIGSQARLIHQIQNKWGKDTFTSSLADPSIFRKTTGGKELVGESVADLFHQVGVRFERANNNIISGITKVNSYLHVDSARRNVFSGGWGAPRMFISDHLSFIVDEISDYYWKKDATGTAEDKPIDHNDHAMDTLKYMFTRLPVAAPSSIISRPAQPSYMYWQEAPNRPIKMARHTA